MINEIVYNQTEKLKERRKNMSVSEEERNIANYMNNGCLPPKEGPYTVEDVLEAKQTTKKVLKNDVEEGLKNLSKVSGINSIKAALKKNKNSVETSLNMKGENGTLNSIKKEFNNGSVEEKSYFKKPENKEERREIGKELKKYGYTQQERADRIGCSQPTISRDDRANKNNKKKLIKEK